MQSQKRGKWTFTKIAPRFVSYDRAETLKFYGDLDFDITMDEEGFLIVSRDGVDIHLNIFEGPADKKKCSVCWIGVNGIEALYEQGKSKNLVSYPLEIKPYGLKEFAANDPSRNLILFAEPVS
ncbi:MAG: glyoxalase superfamily protein [Thaumarchaeota archaeon]|nr:glyoxalase superfamily protein [Nitrososphaerota archaeon]